MLPSLNIGMLFAKQLAEYSNFGKWEIISKGLTPVNGN